ncbi:hypothetical protein ABH909_003443 [Pseudomonas sp. BS3782 TE3695]|uniref:hypothetical protein n=1 Tax=Pseudomonas sp. BS3782 TE3695 TaxID=3349323 RepID=UPI003D19747A
MPLEASMQSRLKDHYDPFPGPDASLFELGELISTYLSQNGVTEEGVIAVALSNFPYHYLSFSPGLQRDVKDKIGERLHTRGKAFEEATGKKFILRVDVPGGGEVDPGIIQQANQHNPGCAEKKIITALERYGEKMTAFAIVAHPAHNYMNTTSSSHVVLAGASQTYIGPCTSCILVGKIHKATLGHLV